MGKNQNSVPEYNFDIKTLKAFSGYCKDEGKLKKSASGGIATAISEAFIMHGGCVFGVIYSSDFRSVEYSCAERISDLQRMQSSKYIQSKKEIFIDRKYVSVFKVIEDKLKKGIPVLFIGLGCDVGAVYSYCRAKKIDTDQLYTIDLICHGPTSPAVAVEYLDWLEAKYHSKISSFSVRYKKYGWVPPYIHTEFKSGAIYEKPFDETDYGVAFSVFLREACFSCKFRGENHCANITIGDYWGIKESDPSYNAYGVSIVFLKSDNKKGKYLLDLIDNSNFCMSSTDVENALKGNPNYWRPWKKHNGYSKFKLDFEKNGLHYAVNNYVSRKWKIKRFVKNILPPSILYVLRLIRDMVQAVR